MKTPEQWDAEGVCYASAARKIQEDAREPLVKVLRRLLQTGLKGADDYRLVMIACKGKELNEDELKAAEDFGEAVKAARSALTGMEER